MTFEEIKQNIVAWNNIVCSSSKIIPYFKGETYYNFSLLPGVSTSQLGVHFYPAIEGNKFVLYVIDISNDNKERYEENKLGFYKYIHTFELLDARSVPFVGDVESLARIPREEALKRELAWIEHHESWIQDKAPVEGIFKAFSFDQKVPSDVYKGNFGLVVDNGPYTYNADIIMQGHQQANYNTVRPVPPYGQGGMEEFFVLQESLSSVESKAALLEHEV